MLRRPRKDSAPAPRRFRAEAFGGIAQLVKPRALVFVDRDMARSLGHDGGARWRGPEARLGEQPLSAPLEAHLQLTNRCDAGCQGCYTGASPAGVPGEWGLAEWKRAIDALADAGVFHLALGGGESATLPWLGEIARHARARGLVPSLTTSGLVGVDDLVAIADHFGQINVSIDGVGETYAAVRGFSGFARADAAVRRLRAVKKEIGLNCVVTRRNFDELGEIFRYARRRRLSEVELLRLKPAGRGATAYSGLTCTDAQHRLLWPTIKRLLVRHRMRVRVDCSYTPMLVFHDPGVELLAKLAVYGCVGGELLVAARATGKMTACSFAAPPPVGPTIDGITSYWNDEHAFGAFRSWRQAAPPCVSCAYHSLCRGGC